MSGTIPPIPPPVGTNTCSPSNSNINRVDTMPNIDTTNTSPTINVSRSVVDDDLLLPQILDSRRGSHITIDNDSDVEEDNITSNESMADLNAKHHERALLANQKRFYKRSGRVGSARKPIDKSKETCFACENPEDEGTTKFKAFMAIAKDEPSVGKSDARSGQWVDITMKKTCSKVTLDQLLFEQIPGNIVKPLGGKGRRKENKSKEVIFTKADISTSESASIIISDLEDDSDNQVPLPPLPKLTGAEPSVASKNLISLSELTANMVDLTLNTASKKIKNSSNKVSQTYVIKKKTKPKHPAVQFFWHDKNALPSTEKLLLTLIEEDHTEQTTFQRSSKNLKGQSTSKPTPIRTTKMPKTFSESKYYGSNKHHFDDCEFYPWCEICGSIAHEIVDCPKNLRNSRKQKVAIKQSEPTKSGFTKGTNLYENVCAGLPKEKNRFDTYVKAKDLDLWNIILNGDFSPLAKNEVTQILEVVSFKEQSDDLKKKLAKNNEAKIVLYNALPKKEYERIFMCKTAKDIWQSLLITHQEESINNGFARFNTIITSLKALNEGFYSKNYVKKFLRAIHPNWRAKVTSIEESKDLSSIALDELIGNLKVHEVVTEKDSEIYKGKKERIKSIALKAKKESSDDETLTYGSDDEEYAMSVRNFKNFFRRKGKFVRKPREERRSLRQREDKKGKSNRKCFRCGDPIHLIIDCPKTSRNKNQKAFIGGSWSDSENDAEDKTNDETCLMA
nr:zf-CCHC domain-containing protein/UBN2 domain-containing protein [Tanacetum cinerariifolium]